MTFLSLGLPFPICLKVSVNSSEAASKINVSSWHVLSVMLWVLMVEWELKSPDRKGTQALCW